MKLSALLRFFLIFVFLSSGKPSRKLNPGLMVRKYFPLLPFIDERLLPMVFPGYSHLRRPVRVLFGAAVVVFWRHLETFHRWVTAPLLVCLANPNILDEFYRFALPKPDKTTPNPRRRFPFYRQVDQLIQYGIRSSIQIAKAQQKPPDVLLENGVLAGIHRNILVLKRSITLYSSMAALSSLKVIWELLGTNPNMQKVFLFAKLLTITIMLAFVIDYTVDAVLGGLVSTGHFQPVIGYSRGRFVRELIIESLKYFGILANSSDVSTFTSALSWLSLFGIRI